MAETHGVFSIDVPGELHVDITTKVRKVVAHVDLYAGGQIVGTTEVNLTSEPRRMFGGQTVNVNPDMGAAGMKAAQDYLAQRAQSIGVHER